MTQDIHIAATSPRHRYNVRSFGATGNGTTDDTAAIRKALTSSEDSYSVYFPAGKYLITEPLTWDPQRVELQGEGATILCNMTTPANYSVKVVNGKPSPTVGSAVPSYASARWARSRGLAFVSNNSSNGLMFERVTHVTLSNMRFQGFRIAHWLSNGVSKLRFRDCVVSDSTRNAVYAAGSGSAGAAVPMRHGAVAAYNGCDFTRNANASWLIEATGAQRLFFSNCSLTASPKLLHAADSSVVSLVTCLVKNRGSVYDGVTGDIQPTVQVDNQALVRLRQSTVEINTQGTRDISHVFQVAPGARASTDMCTMRAERVKAWVSGGGRTIVRRTHQVTTAGVGGAPDSFPTMLALDSRHNCLHLGVRNSPSVRDSTETLTATTSGWTSTRGTLTVPPEISVGAGHLDKRDVLVVTYNDSAASTLSFTVPLTGGERKLAYWLELATAGPASTLRVAGVTVKLFDTRTPTSTSTPIAEFSQEGGTAALSSTDWTTLRAGWDLSTVERHPEFFRSATITFAIAGATPGSILHASRAFVNAFS